MRRSFAGLAAAVFLAVSTMSGCSAPASSPSNTDDLLWPVDDFALTERNGQTVRRDDLKGKVWVAGFFFTCCNQTCPTISANLAELQRQLAGQDDVVLVSISVDPLTDSPEQLRKYAETRGADAKHWLFLTGDPDAIYRLSEQSFHEHAEKATHGNHLFLVDRQGRVRTYVDGTQPEEVARLGERIAVMTSPLPMINAGLNGTSALLLVLGYAAIRARKVALHKGSMLAALAVSAGFLASYLYYHLAVCRGQPTHFLGEGDARTVYFAVLISHTLLAVVAAPLALVTAYLGLSNRLNRHMRLARWTLPIWLYVSVTGVVVYWMLYRLYPSS